MTFYTSDTAEMGCLIRQPVMCLQDIYLFTFRQKLKMAEVGMAIQADRIVV